MSRSLPHPNPTFFTIVLTGFVNVTSLIKISHIVGSYASFFSINQCITPLSGFFGNVNSCTTLFACRAFFKFFKVGTYSIPLTAYHIPTFFASLYVSLLRMQTRNRWEQSLFILICLLSPLLCMALFLVHPVGSQAALYTIYWIIPPLVALSKTRSLFLQALGTTCTAHAFGSVIQLYTHSLHPKILISLIPQVALERLFFASGIAVCVILTQIIIHTYRLYLFSFTSKALAYTTTQP
jgi:hypothetical protein